MVKGPRSTVSRLKHAETIFQASELAGSKSKNQEDCENLVHSRACRPMTKESESLAQTKTVATGSTGR